MRTEKKTAFVEDEQGKCVKNPAAFREKKQKTNKKKLLVYTENEKICLKKRVFFVFVFTGRRNGIQNRLFFFFFYIELKCIWRKEQVNVRWMKDSPPF